MLVDEARDAEFRSISFDLIYGLPHQGVDSFDRTLDLVIAMRPDRLAVYNYAHLPGRFKGQRMIDEADLPPPATRLRILEHTIARLDDAGYVYVGMDHFALPDDDLVTARRDGTLQRNFQGYSTHGGCDLVGLGVSSIGSVGNVYAQNAATTMEYESLVDAGKLAIRRGVRVDADDALRAAVIQSLMCYDRVDFASIDASHNVDTRNYFANEIGRLAPLVDDGLAEVDDAGISVTPRGRLFLRNIAMAFDRYIDHAGEDGRYSKVI
jgi:oxygen-independent coproporphyrinogen III oxidase